MVVTSWFPEKGSFSNHGSDHIWIHIRRRPSILKVTFSIFFCVSSNPNRASTVCHTLYKMYNINFEVRYSKSKTLRVCLDNFFLKFLLWKNHYFLYLLPICGKIQLFSLIVWYSKFIEEKIRHLDS